MNTKIDGSISAQRPRQDSFENTGQARITHIDASLRSLPHQASVTAPGATVIAPELPLQKESIDAIVLQMNASIAMLSEVRAKQAKVGIEVTDDQRKRHAEQARQHAKNAIDAMEKAEQFDPVQKGLSWFAKAMAVVGALFGLVGALAAAGASAGAAAPLVALAGIGLMQALTDIGTGVCQELKVKDDFGNPIEISFGRGIAELSILIDTAIKDAAMGGHGELFEKLKNDPKARNEMVNHLTMGIEMTMMVTTLVGGIATGNAAAKVVRLSEDASRIARVASSIGSRVINAGVDVVQGATARSSAGIAIHVTQLQLNADNETTHKSYQEARMRLLNMVFDRYAESLKTAISAFSKAIEDSSRMLEEANHTRLSVSRKINAMN